MVPHNDVDAVDAALAGRTQPRALVLVETIYSVLGDAAPVERLAEVCAARGAVLVADEAHALGVAGPGGRGLLHAGRARRTSTDVVATLTLSKSLGAQGGAVLATPAVREHLVNRARPFIYDTGLAPAAAGGALAALAGRRGGAGARRPGQRGRRGAGRGVRRRRARPARCWRSPMPGPREAVAAVEKAAGNGVRIGCFRPPSTPDGISRLRLTAHAQLDRRGARTGRRGARRACCDGRSFVTGTDTGVGKTVVTAALAAVAARTAAAAVARRQARADRGRRRATTAT